MKRSLAIALVLVAMAAACSDREKTTVDFGRRSATPPAESLPTPEPPAEGAWALAVDSAGDGCGLGALPEVVFLAGDGREWQVTLQPFFLDATGVLEGDALAMNGSAQDVRRPTLDCVIAERDTWALTRTAPETLVGELSRVQETSAGHDCAEAVPDGIELPCLSRWHVRLDHRSAKRAPTKPPD